MTNSVFQFLVLCSLLFGSLAHATRAAQMPPIEERTYEDWFTFKHGKSYTYDPWVWAYTAEFAERFRMPKQWIEPELKGVLAVAFRMTTIGRTTCGLGGRADNCWPTLECQMDVYYDNSIQLPWNREDIQSDFLMDGISSFEYTGGREGYVEQHGKKYPKAGQDVVPGTGVQTSLIIDNSHGGGPTRVAYYNKKLLSDIGVISYVGSVCPNKVGIGRLNFRSHEVKINIMRMKINAKTASSVHVMEFPISFMRRANAVYERDNKPNDQVTDRLIQQFFNSKNHFDK